VTVERKYVASQEAAASLHDGACDLAGLRSRRALRAAHARALRPLARPRSTRLIHVATRHQGLMVAPGNPRKIYGVADLARPDVRFINRQRGSGTRFLLDCLLEDAHVDPEPHRRLRAGRVHARRGRGLRRQRMADAGSGWRRRASLQARLRAARLRTLLPDVPRAVAGQAGIQATLEILRSAEFEQAVNLLSGYSAQRCGEVETLKQAFPEFHVPRSRAARLE
jgi:molybdate-binding protein